MLIREIMTRDPVTVDQDNNLAEVLHRFHAGNFRHLPVISLNNALIGMISLTDLYRVLALTNNQSIESKEDELRNTLVQEVMETPAPLVLDDESVESVVDLFLREKLEALSVVDRHSRITGIVTLIDMLKLLRNCLKR